MSDAREHALNILEQFRIDNQQIKSIQELYYYKNKIPVKHRARIHVIVHEVLRWKRRLDYWISSALIKPIHSLQPRLLTLFEIASWELLMDEKSQDYAVIHSAVELAKKRVGKHTAGLVNAVLRNLSKIKTDQKPKNVSTAEWMSLPDWLFDRWEEEFQENVVDLCESINKPSRLTIRRNVNKISNEQFIEELTRDGIQCIKLNDSDRFYHVHKGGSLLRNHSLFKNGSISFQDRGAGAVVELLNPLPNDTIVDVCAAPGTKALYCSEKMNGVGKIYAFDIDEDRVHFGKKDIKRHRMNNIQWGIKDAIKDTYPMADKILIDAPCTGTGVIGRKPDIKWRRNKEDIIEMQTLQTQILQNVSHYVKTDGILCYSTCSIEREENWNVVEAFLKLNDGFQLKDSLELYPHKTHTDGMFAVILERLD